MKICWLTILTALLFVGFELAVAQGDIRDVTDKNREKARVQAERQEQQRVIEFKNVIEARKLRGKQWCESAEALGKEAVTACNRARYDAALSVFNMYEKREGDCCYERWSFNLRQARIYKKQLSATDKEIDRLHKEFLDTRNGFTQNEIQGKIYTQERIKTDLKYRIAAHLEMADAASSYQSFTKRLDFIEFPKDCPKETHEKIEKPGRSCLSRIRSDEAERLMCIVSQKVVYSPEDGHLADAIWERAYPPDMTPVEEGVEIAIHGKLTRADGSPVGRGTHTYGGSKINKDGFRIYHWNVSPDYWVRVIPEGALREDAATLTIVPRSSQSR